MDVIKAILSSKNIIHAYKLVQMDFVRTRYPFESIVVGFLAHFALNKEKNKIKPNFEDQKILYIFNHLLEEVAELKQELLKENMDFERVLDETADIAALCCGIVSWVQENKGK